MGKYLLELKNNVTLHPVKSMYFLPMENIVNGFNNLPFLYILDLIGTVVFAMSGAIVAREHKMDIFGSLILAFVTGMGGGTLRDAMIGATPVFWMKSLEYIGMIVLGVVLVRLLKNITNDNKQLLVLDTIGLAVFAVIGIEKALKFELSPIIAITLGTVTGTFGGLIRDLLCGKMPTILHREIYATPCLVGGALFFLLRYMQVEGNLLYVLTTFCIILIRLLAVRYKWQLPKA